MTAAAAAFVAASSTGFAYDRHVRIVNRTNYTMTELYASNVGTNDW